MPKKVQKSRRNILIVGAMREELSVFREYNRIQSEFSEYHLYIEETGIGKVNSALYTAHRINDISSPLINRGKIIRYGLGSPVVPLAILVGTCGGIAPGMKVGDIVIATDTLQHDMDVSELGFDRGVVPFAKQSKWEANQRWLDRAKDSLSRLNCRGHFGTVLTGDRFISNESESQALHEEFNAVAVEFEGSAFAQVCEFYKIPWLIIKVVSDSAGDEACEEFSSFLKTSSERCYKVVEDLLINL